MDIDKTLREHGYDPEQVGQRFALLARLLLVYVAANDYRNLHSVNEAEPARHCGPLANAYAAMCIAIEGAQAELKKTGIPRVNADEQPTM